MNIKCVDFEIIDHELWIEFEFTNNTNNNNKEDK